MRVLFIGVGSIAFRHIRNLKTVKGEEVLIDVVRSGKGREISADIADNISCVFAGRDSIHDHYDAVFITNPTSLHYDTLCRYHDLSEAFFIEKPVFLTGYEDISRFDDGKKYYVACPLRYSGVIQWLKSNIDFSKVYSMRVLASSYLPDWRPETDYRKCYSAHKNMGGGVSVDLIHEWDYITYLAGRPNCVKSIIRKESGLEIESDDIAVYIAEFNDKVVELHLDYFGRKTRRCIELIMDDDTIVVDLETQKIQWLCSGRIMDFNEDRDDYQKKELIHFLDIISGKIPCDNTLRNACELLKISRGET